MFRLLIASLIVLPFTPLFCAEKAGAGSHSETAGASQDPLPDIQKLKEIELRDPQTEGIWTLESIAQKGFKGIVVFSLSSGCEKAKYRIPEIIKLAEDYRKKGIQVVGLDGFDADSTTDILRHIQEFNLNFPILHDPEQKLTQALGIKRINEFILLDPSLKKLYRGDISDGYTSHGSRAVTEPYLKNAINQHLDGKEITKPRTTTDGCRLSHIPEKPLEGINYCKHIAPIIKAKCQGCHVEGGAGPFSLTSTEDAKNWAETIKEVVSERRMPPWNALEKGFSNDRSLTESEIQKIISWVDLNTPDGDPKDCPTPRTFKDGWSIGEPDLVVSTNNPFPIPAAGEIPYQYLRTELPPIGENPKARVSVKLPEKYKNGAWVEKSEVRPGSKRVHHAIVHNTAADGATVDPAMVKEHMPTIKKIYADIPEGPNKPDFMTWLKEFSKISSLYDPKKAAVAGSFVPGQGTREFPGGYATFIPAGSTLTFEMHYTPGGVATTDFTQGKGGKPGHTTEIGLKFTDKPVRAVITNPLGLLPLRIPAGDPNYEVTKDFKFDKDSSIMFLQPHMHKLGKNIKYELILPNGTKQTILSVPKWDFNWQTEYRFAQPVKAPAGSVLKITARFDNSVMNTHNPNKIPKDVAWGFSTDEEMMNGWLGYAHDETLGEQK